MKKKRDFSRFKSLVSYHYLSNCSPGTYFKGQISYFENSVIKKQLVLNKQTNYLDFSVTTSSNPYRTIDSEHLETFIAI